MRQDRTLGREIDRLRRRLGRIDAAFGVMVLVGIGFGIYMGWQYGAIAGFLVALGSLVVPGALFGRRRTETTVRLGELYWELGLREEALKVWKQVSKNQLPGAHARKVRGEPEPLPQPEPPPPEAPRIPAVGALPIAVSILAVVASIAVHETAHALTAAWFGDATAQRQGRISLNPIRRVDPFGTVVIPLLLAVSGGAVFGWAKPTPVRTENMRRPRRAGR